MERSFEKRVARLVLENFTPDGAELALGEKKLFTDGDYLNRITGHP